MIRVVLVGDGRVPHGTLLSLPVRQPDIGIMGHVGFADDVASAVAGCAAAVVVVNTDYMVSQVLPLVADLRAQSPDSRVLMLVDPTKPGMLPPRRRSQGLSFIARDAPFALLAETIRRLARGERVIDPRLELAVLGAPREVSTRELEVLGLAAEGSSVAEIAGRLRLANGTVRNYLSAVIAKTGARNRIDAIRIVRRDGWLR